MIRILVVDDQPLARAGLARIFETAEDLEVVGECEDGSEVSDAVARLTPDIVVMDVRMPDVDGIEATRLLTDLDDAPPVLVLTTFGEEETVAAALGAGAAGFVLKDARGEDLITAARAVAGGGAWLDQSIIGDVISTYRRTVAPRAAQADRLEELTEREREVLQLVGRGLTNHEIAARLYITEATVKSHVSSILSKLDARDRAGAIVLAFDHGLVQPGGDPDPS